MWSLPAFRKPIRKGSRNSLNVRGHSSAISVFPKLDDFAVSPIRKPLTRFTSPWKN